MSDTEKARRLLNELAAMFGCAVITTHDREVLVTSADVEYEVGGTKKLKDKYGEGKTRTIVNRAIRAEIPGGAQVLDARTELHKSPSNHKHDQSAIEFLDAALLDMENEIRARYGMNSIE